MGLFYHKSKFKKIKIKSLFDGEGSWRWLLEQKKLSHIQLM
ncbi:hypothetical protein bcere0004_55500 [Bacillus cereus BGSC 6E1]|nr:hypothetical protein bcere0004_55500 [Bacillus cereus BGSC 6E1]